MKDKILYINIDGFSYSYYERLMKEFPDGPFAKLCQEGLLFSELRSGLISITNPMQSAILCGAWSNRTHNFYQHYDWNEGKIIKHRRICDIENIGEKLFRAGKTVVSIHQFMLEGRPCEDGIKERAYFRCSQEKSNAFHRLDILEKIIQKRPVQSGNKEFIYDDFPDFLALYIDDIDTLGHNNAYEKYPKRSLFEERQKDIMERLNDIGERLLFILELCKKTERYDELTIAITTDHGMTPFFGKSSLPDLIHRICKKGIKADLPENRTSATQVVVVPYTIEASLYCNPDMAESDKEIIRKLCVEAPYVDRVFTKPEMRDDYGMDLRGPDFLISPSQGKHFYHRDIDNQSFGAGHDSFDDTSQHIFGLIVGGSIPQNSTCKERAYVIDILPRIMAHNLLMWC